MTQSVDERRQSRIQNDLRRVEAILADVDLDLGKRTDARARACRNALAAVRYALRGGSATISPVGRSPKSPVVK